MGAQFSGDQLKLNALDTLTAVGGDLVTSTLILFSNNPTVDPNGDATQFTEPTFVGYAAVAALVFSSAYKDVDGKFKVSAPSETFERTGGAVSDTIYGWCITDAAKTELRAWKFLDNPVSLLAAGQGLTVQPEFSWGS